MSYLVLARKWRPQRFAEVVGQRHVALTLTSALEGNRLSHAYVFSGPRGVGKTSMARILAKALNCERGPASEPCNACDACRTITEGHCLDVLEIDGASNRGIDDVRQLRESVKYAPASVRAKVYIIDEVHMLTADAFNALLKTLEEPPAHVYFVLATTEPLKVPATILSRCQRHDFGRLTVAELMENLKRIVSAEGISVEEEALRLIARKAEGSVRDTLTLLDQVTATGAGPFQAAQVQEILGLAGSALYFALSEAVVSGDGRAALTNLDRAYREGLNLQELADELVQHFRNLLLISMDAGLVDLLDATGEEAAEFSRQAARVRPADALRWLRILLDTGPRMRRSPHSRVHLELALAEMAALPRSVELARLLERLGPGGCCEAKPQGAGASASEAGTQAPGAEAGAPGDHREPRASDAAAHPKAPRKPAAGAAPGDSQPHSLQADWERLLGLMRQGRAFLASCLHESRAVEIAEGRLIVHLDDPNGFKREQLEKPTNRRQVLRWIEEAFGQPLGIKFVDAAAASQAGKAPEAEAGPREAAAPPAEGGPAGRVSDGPGRRQVGGGAGRQPSPGVGPGAEDARPGKARVREIADLVDGDIIGPAR